MAAQTRLDSNSMSLGPARSFALAVHPISGHRCQRVASIRTQVHTRNPLRYREMLALGDCDSSVLSRFPCGGERHHTYTSERRSLRLAEPAITKLPGTYARWGNVQVKPVTVSKAVRLLARLRISNPEIVE